MPRGRMHGIVTLMCRHAVWRCLYSLQDGRSYRVHVHDHVRVCERVAGTCVRACVSVKRTSRAPVVHRWLSVSALTSRACVCLCQRAYDDRLPHPRPASTSKEASGTPAAPTAGSPAREQTHKHVHVARLGPGDTFGEMELILRPQCTTRCVVTCLPQWAAGPLR